MSMYTIKKLFWERGVDGSEKAFTPLVRYRVREDFWISAVGGDIQTHKCQSTEDGQKQAQEHWEKLIGTMLDKIKE